MTETTFCGLRLLAEPGKVMTPRPATEALVEAAVERIGDRPALVADVGTGSGAVALAIATRAARARIWATDTSCAAVRLARANVCRHGLGDRISVARADLLDGVPGRLDLVAANLPYLAAALRPHRPELAGEPADAVFAPGDGLDPYRRLLDACRSALRPDGLLVIQLHGRVVAREAAVLHELELAA
ncbi:MAG TPA: class I SAM-dependent methyltransferase [Gaiellaceae bacterium]|nr:class I SAM-dependent methyltransferase [Gaiellaceae bacterium]